jgi:hypothetical protein
MTQSIVDQVHRLFVEKVRRDAAETEPLTDEERDEICRMMIDRSLDDILMTISPSVSRSAEALRDLAVMLHERAGAIAAVLERRHVIAEAIGLIAPGDEGDVLNKIIEMAPAATIEDIGVVLRVSLGRMASFDFEVEREEPLVVANRDGVEAALNLADWLGHMLVHAGLDQTVTLAELMARLRLLDIERGTRQ